MRVIIFSFQRSVTPSSIRLPPHTALRSASTSSKRTRIGRSTLKIWPAYLMPTPSSSSLSIPLTHVDPFSHASMFETWWSGPKIITSGSSLMRSTMVSHSVNSLHSVRKPKRDLSSAWTEWRRSTSCQDGAPHGSSSTIRISTWGRSREPSETHANCSYIQTRSWWHHYHTSWIVSEWGTWSSAFLLSRRATISLSKVCKALMDSNPTHHRGPSTWLSWSILTAWTLQTTSTSLRSVLQNKTWVHSPSPLMDRKDTRD